MTIPALLERSPFGSEVFIIQLKAMELIESHRGDPENAPALVPVQGIRSDSRYLTGMVKFEPPNSRSIARLIPRTLPSAIEERTARSTQSSLSTVDDLVGQHIADMLLSNRPDQIAAGEFFHYLCIPASLHYCTEIRSSKAINSG